MNIEEKYPQDNQWFDNDNIQGGWTNAFHGIDSNLQTIITRKGFFTTCRRKDPVIDEAIEQMGDKANGSSIYVTKECEGGAHPHYTISFTIPSSSTADEKRRYYLIFQCRVKPNTFSSHRRLFKESTVCRVLEADAIRPYALLLKTEE